MAQGATKVINERTEHKIFTEGLDDYNRKNFWNPICFKCAMMAKNKGEVHEVAECEKFRTMKFMRFHKAEVSKMNGHTIYGIMLDFKCHDSKGREIGHGFSMELFPTDIKKYAKQIKDLGIDAQTLRDDFGIDLK